MTDFKTRDEAKRVFDGLNAVRFDKDRYGNSVLLCTRQPRAHAPPQPITASNGYSVHLWCMACARVWDVPVWALEFAHLLPGADIPM